MCQLLGISYNKPTCFNDIFNEFSKRGERNPDAWGLAYWTGDGCGPAVVREARAAHQSPLAAAIARSKTPATTVIAHVRAATTAGAWSKKATTNAHPFIFGVPMVGLKSRREWVFAHNGYVRIAALPLWRRVEGSTDSERFFAVLADKLAATKGGPHDTFDTIAGTAAFYAKSGRLNFLASDGETLYFHASHAAVSGGLYYMESATKGKKAVVVATRPLFTNAGWVPAVPGVLYAANAGKIVRKEKAVERNAKIVWFEPSLPKAPKAPKAQERHMSYIDYLEAETVPRQKALFNCGAND